jgi:hypothetical protein
LSQNQKAWPIRDIEAYAILRCLLKWELWIGQQPVAIHTDHKSLEVWHTEKIHANREACGRHLRWHQEFARFQLTIQYIPGPQNLLGDGMSRWAYPATSEPTVGLHGQAADEAFVERAEEEEQEEALEDLLGTLRHQEGIATLSWVPNYLEGLGPLNLDLQDFILIGQIDDLEADGVPLGRFRHCVSCDCKDCRYRTGHAVQPWNIFPTSRCKCAKCRGGVTSPGN